MNSKPVFALWLTLGLVSGAVAEQVPFGIVYGPKAAFNIAAPVGWVIDNSGSLREGGDRGREEAPRRIQAVAYIVYTADNEAAFRKYQSALQELVKSFTYLEPKKDQ